MDTARSLSSILVRCDACRQMMPPEQLVGETRHVGGKEDRVELYCRSGYGHRQSEPQDPKRD